jgi:type II restriction enzyme
MKYHPIFEEYIHCTDSNQVFQYLKNSLTDSITMWDYFVNWGKVLGNVHEVEIDLNTLNYLVGKPNVEDEFATLLEKQPHLVRVLPILLATREGSFKILVDASGGNLQYQDYSFKDKTPLSKDEIMKICEFANKTGLLDLFRNKYVKSVPDYVLGVEVGLDSNGRKNRGGTTMENLIEEFIRNVCEKDKYQFLSQVNASEIKRSWGIDVQVDKSSRRFDFAVRKEQSLYIIETNFYGGGGSKLKATAGEYKSLFDFLSAQSIKFIWITDGLGWKTTLRPLEEAFNHIEYTLNLKMVASGLFEEIIKKDF